MYKDNPDNEGRPVLAMDSQAPSKPAEDNGFTSTIHPSVPIDPRSLLDHLAPGVWYMLDGSHPRSRNWEISEMEKVIFADLLGRLLRYRPQDRISAQSALDHEWFKP